MSSLDIFSSWSYAGISFGAGFFSSSVIISICFSICPNFSFLFFSSVVVIFYHIINATAFCLLLQLHYLPLN